MTGMLQILLFFHYLIYLESFQLIKEDHRLLRNDDPKS